MHLKFSYSNFHIYMVEKCWENSTPPYKIAPTLKNKSKIDRNVYFRADAVQW